jgi:hypothetical protein
LVIVIADRDELGNETVSADFDALCCGEGAVVAKDGTVSDKETASALGDKTLVENAVRTETDRRPTCDADPNTTADITTATEADAGVKTTVDGEAPSSRTAPEIQFTTPKSLASSCEPRALLPERDGVIAGSLCRPRPAE